MATLRSPRAGTVDECHGHTSLELAAALCDAYDGGCGGVTAAIADGVTYYQTRAARETVLRALAQRSGRVDGRAAVLDPVWRRLFISVALQHLDESKEQVQHQRIANHQQ